MCFRIEVIIDANNAIEATPEELDEDEDVEVSHILISCTELNTLVLLQPFFLPSFTVTVKKPSVRYIS